MANSYVTYTGDGSTDTYAVPFKYISETHVYVKVDGTLVSFTWQTDGTIKLDTAPGSGATVRVFRSTPMDDRFVDFINGAGLHEEDLDLDSDQIFYIMQEIEETRASVEQTENVLSAIDQAQTAQTAAEAAQAAAEAAATAAENIANGVPAGGANGDALLKASADDHDLTWGAVVHATEVSATAAAGKIPRAGPDRTIDASYLPATPAGVVSFFARDTAPDGWLKCNGAVISRATYDNLFTAIGETFGAGDGETTFALPDLRGEFLRAFDDGRGVDASRAFGSAQNATKHPYIVGTNMSFQFAYQSPENLDATSTDNYERYYLSNPSSGSTMRKWYTSRPRNVALLACIKY